MDPISERLWKRAGELKFPLTAAFELLPLCNLSCKMCYVRKTSADVEAAGGLIRAEQWLAWAEQAKSLGLLYPLLTGGEPFLHPDFRQILTGFQQMGLQVSLNSNGTMIDRETARWLGQHRPTRINMTLYGASAETYSRLCGNGDAFERVRRAVEYLTEFNVPVKFNYSATPQNIQDLDAVMAYAREVGKPIQVATYMFPPVRRDAQSVGQNDRMTPEEAGMARVRADYLQSESDWFIGQARRFSHFVDPDRLDLPDDGPELGMQCRAGVCSFWIDWEGNMVNCGMYGSAKLPLEGRQLAEVWRQLTAQTQSYRFAPVCASCPNIVLCHPCMAMVHNECGGPTGRPEYLCRMNHAAARGYREYLHTYFPDADIAESSEAADWQRCELDEF